jgi:oxygen-independent coproporphyrinogen-3 oxidase
MDKEIIDTEEKMYEYVILGLRMTKGIKKEDFYGRFNVNIMDKYKEVLEKYIKKGYLKDENGYISFSEKGLDISNYILSEI